VFSCHSTCRSKLDVANRQAAHLFGLSVEQIQGKSLGLYLAGTITEPAAGPAVVRHTSGVELPVDVLLTKLDFAFGTQPNFFC
jgi:hypothetical protein